MKNVSLLMLLPLFLFGCSKESEDALVTPTTYQIFNNMAKNTSTMPYLDGSLYEVVVYCYVGVDIVRQDNYDAIAPGQKTTIKEVPPTYTKIKVSFKFLPPASDYYDMASNTRKYIVTYTLLEVEKNTISEINGNSMVSSSMNAPSKSNSTQMSKIVLIQ